MLSFEDFVVGESAPLGSLAVSEGDIVAFARRFDPQDFHTDPEAARQSFVGGLIGSGWHSCALLMRLMAEGFLLDAAALGAPGIDEVKWIRPVRPGDVLSATRTVIETKVSQSRPQMGLVRFRLVLANQRDEPVLEQTNWIMFARRGEPFARPEGDWLSHPASYDAPDRALAIEPPAEAPEPTRFWDDLEIGRTFALGSVVFTADEIVAFARSFDPQPFHLSEEAARASPTFGRLAASGWHTGAAWMATMVSHRRRQEKAALAAGLRPARLGPSPGFSKLRWSRPVFAGDRITYSSTLTDKRASASRPGWGLFFHRNVGVNQHGDEVFSFDGCAFIERQAG